MLKGNPPPPGMGGWVGGGSEAKTSLCTKNRPQFSGPFTKFHFVPEEKFSDVEGREGRLGLGRAPNTPPPPLGGLEPWA